MYTSLTITGIEFIVGLILWWVAVYIITQNPFSRLMQLMFGILTSSSVYLTTDFILAIATHSGDFAYFGSVLQYMNWAIYLPILFIYHISYLLIAPKRRQLWQKVALYLGYSYTLLAIYLESFTNLTRDYHFINSAQFSGDLAKATGEYFWVVPLQIFVILAGTINFYLLFKSEKKYSRNWYMYLWPFIGLVGSLMISPFIALSYYDIIPHQSGFATSLPILSYGIITATFIFSIFRYGLLIEDSKIVFSKKFTYSSLAILIVLAVYAVINSQSLFEISSPQALIAPYLLLYAVIASHPVYGWLETWMENIIYTRKNGFQSVSDKEVAEALRNYHRPERLANSSLLRLGLTTQALRKGEANNPVEALQCVLRQAIEGLAPHTDKDRRLKQNLKYQILRMIAYHQAEEGQILWELGFSDYPVRVMAMESSQHTPKLKIKSPADYAFTSRNAYFNLKQEAIHDVAWRISYLEKLNNKGVKR